MKKIGRNDPCPCGSGKKFKKCCESKMIGKRFMASKIDTTGLMQKSSGLSSLFQRAMPLPRKTEDADSSLDARSVQIKKKEENSGNITPNAAEKIFQEEKDKLNPSPKTDDPSSQSSKKDDKSS